MAANEKIDFRLPKKEKRPHDVFFLENGLQVTIVSDDTADQAAAALDVRVGALCDPWEIQGMAHFLEHMLFLGTEKYPDENSYSSFLQENGGHSNAYTAAESTNYYFDVVHNKLEEALDRFSQFFISPLFTESATDRERNAIESEHSKNIQNDVWRFHQLSKNLVNKEHPFSKFSTGNMQTLKTDTEEKGIDVRERLFEFHKKYYSSSIMKLAVVGRDPLPVMKEWVTQKFSPIKNLKITPPYPPWKIDGDEDSIVKGAPPIILPGDFNKLFRVVPIKDLRQLRLMFPIPPVTKNYRKKPDHYVAHLLGHEGEGSVLSVLKKRNLANGIVAGPTVTEADFSVFSVAVDLSELGEERWTEVAGIVFQYIQQLQKAGPKQHIFQELQDMGEIEFEMMERSTATTYVGFLTSTMQLYDPVDVVAGPFILHEFDEELIKETVLSRLTPENMVAFLVSPSFEGKAEREERWYGTKFSEDRIPTDVVSSWVEAHFCDDLEEPTPNIFIPKKLDVKPYDGPPLEESKEGEKNYRDPEIIYDSPLVRLYHKQDTKFELPKANVYFQFTVPHAYNSPWGSVCSSLFVKLCDDALNHFVYDADIAGLKFSLVSVWNGVRLRVKGFDEKIELLTLKIIDTMHDLAPCPDRFLSLKEQYLRDLRNFAISQPYEHGRYFSDLLMHQVYWSFEEKLAELERLTLDDIFRIKDCLFSHVKIEALVHGNYVSSEAIHLIKSVESRFEKSLPLPLSQHPDRRIVQFPSGAVQVLQRDVLSATEPNSCLYMFFQIGPESIRMNALADLFAQLIREAAFDQLRTKEQLGYIVFSSVHSAHGVQGFRLIVQSSVADPLYLEQRVESFLLQFGERLEKLTDELFQSNIKSLITRKLEEDRHLSQETDRIWDSIIRHKDGFNLRVQEAEAVATFTKEDVLNFYKTYLLKGSAERRKMTINLFGCNHSQEKAGTIGPAENDQDYLVGEERVLIEDFDRWKRSHPLFHNTA